MNWWTSHWLGICRNMNKQQWLSFWNLNAKENIQESYLKSFYAVGITVCISGTTWPLSSEYNSHMYQHLAWVMVRKLFLVELICRECCSTRLSMWDSDFYVFKHLCFTFLCFLLSYTRWNNKVMLAPGSYCYFR